MSGRLSSALVAAALVCATAASAQTPATARRPTPPPQDPFTVRGFGDVGMTRFTAAESFKATLGTSSGSLFGGGIEVDLRAGVFFALRASRFRHDGHRVFVFEGEIFDLDVDETVTVTPIEANAGYRFRQWSGLVPFVGGGIGWHRYQETSRSATGNENVTETFRGYQLLGGAEARLTKAVAAAAEAQWTTVPDALGSDANSVSAAFDEHDLGGLTFRAKIIVGF